MMMKMTCKLSEEPSQISYQKNLGVKPELVHVVGHAVELRAVLPICLTVGQMPAHCQPGHVYTREPE